MEIKTLHDIELLGFQITEEVVGISEVNKIIHPETISVDNFLNNSYQTRTMEFKRDKAEITYTLKRMYDGSVVKEGLNNQHVINFFNTGEYKNHL